jgi:transposase InsO family protein
MCSLLNLSKSSYHAWIRSKFNSFMCANKKLDVHIKAVFSEHHGRYGSPRITRALRALKINCSKNRIAKRMQILKIQALAKRKFKVTTESAHSLLVYDNIIGRDFNAHAINKKWVGYITYYQQKKAGFI